MVVGCLPCLAMVVGCLPCLVEYMRYIDCIDPQGSNYGALGVVFFILHLLTHIRHHSAPFGISLGLALQFPALCDACRAMLRCIDTGHGRISGIPSCCLASQTRRTTPSHSVIGSRTLSHRYEANASLQHPVDKRVSCHKIARVACYKIARQTVWKPALWLIKSLVAPPIPSCMHSRAHAHTATATATATTTATISAGTGSASWCVAGTALY